MERVCQDQIVIAVISVLLLIGVFATLLYIMYKSLVAKGKQKNIDKSLQLKYENMKSQNSILMAENVRVMEVAEDLAILLSQKKNKL